MQQAAEAEEEAEGLYESPFLLLNVDELPELLAEVRAESHKSWTDGIEVLIC